MPGTVNCGSGGDSVILEDPPARAPRGSMNRMVTTPSDAAAGPGFTTTSRVDSDTAFRGARRHSRNVRLLRIFVPAGVVGGIFLVSLVTYVSSGKFSYK